MNYRLLKLFAILAAAGVVTPPPPPGPNPPPPPPPAPPTIAPDQLNNLSLGFISTDTGTQPFCGGQAFRKGEVPSGSSVAVSGATTAQVTPKNFWPDGSLKYAIISGTASFTANTWKYLTLGVGTASTGSTITKAALRATGITATFTAGAFGSATWAANSVDWENPVLNWVSGHAMSSWIYRKQIGSDPHLVAWVEVRMFANGEIEVYPWIENGYLMVTGPTNKSATYTFTLNGVQRFNQTVDIAHHQRTMLIGSSSPAGGAELSYWAGANQRKVRPKMNQAYLESTLQVPSYDPGLYSPTWGGDVTSTYEPFQRSQYRVSMPDGGGHPSIGLIPRWEAAHLVTDDPVAFESMVRMGYGGGRYGIHYRDETTQRPVNFSDSKFGNADGARLTTSVVVQSDGKYHLTPSSTFYNLTYTPAPSGTALPEYETGHAYAPPYVTYLTTGLYYFLEEVQFMAGVNFLMSGISREGNAGLILDWYMQTRQRAWNFRTLFMATAATPDYLDDIARTVDPLKAGYVYSVDYNVNFYHGRRNNPFGIVVQGEQWNDGNQPWQHDFYVSALGFGFSHLLGSNSTQRTKLEEVFRWSAQGTVGRFGGIGANEWPYFDAAGSPQGNADIASVFSATPDQSYRPETGAGNFFANWGEMYSFWQRRMVTNRIASDVASSGSSPYTDPGPQANPGVYMPIRGAFYPSYNGLLANSFLALGYCLTHGVTGAVEGWNRLTSAPNWKEQLDSCRANWAPEYMMVGNVGHDTYVPARGFRANVNLNNATDVDFENGVASPGKWYNGFYGVNSFVSIFSGSWSSGTMMPGYSRYGAYGQMGGGHGGNIATILYGVDATTNLWFAKGAAYIPPNHNWTGLNVISQSGQVYTQANDLRDQTYYAYNYNGSEVGVMPHQYTELSYASEVHGGGPKGSLIFATYWKTEQPTHAPSSTPRYFNLVTEKIARASDSVTDAAGSGSMTAVRDTVNQREWWFFQGQSTIQYFDQNDAKPKARKSVVMNYESGSIGGVGVYNHSYEMCREAKMIFVVAGEDDGTGTGTAKENGRFSVTLIDVATGNPSQLSQARVPMSPNGFARYGGFAVSACWNPHDRALYIYEGRGLDYMIVLRPSSLDFRTCSWSWSKEQFAGPTPTNVFAGTTTPQLLSDQFSPRRNLRYNEAKRNLIWIQGPSPTGVCVDGVTRNGIVQEIKTPGVVVA